MVSITYSTLPFLHLHPLEAVQTCLLNGADNVEVFMEGPKWSSMTDSERKKLAKELKQLPCQYSVHPPQFDLNLSSSWRTVQETALKEYKKAIYFAGEIHASYIVIDPGYRHLSLTSLKDARKMAKKGIEALLAEAESCNVRIGIENGPVSRKALFNEDEFVSFVQSFNHPRVGAVLDTGHAQLANWEIARVINNLDSSLLAVHLNDTSGRVDNHLPLGKGVIKWKSVFDELNQLTNHVNLVLELNLRTNADSLHESRRYIINAMK